MRPKLHLESSNNLDSNKQNQAPIEKKQRRKKPEILKFRTKVWYQSVRFLTGMKDGDLDLEFGPKDESGNPRVYVDRVRIFEELRKRSSSIIRVIEDEKGNKSKKGKRDFDLIDEVANKPGLEKTKELYEMPFWACIADRKPTIESMTNHMASMINALSLLEKPLKIKEDEIVDLRSQFGISSSPPSPRSKFDYGSYDFQIEEFTILLNCLGQKGDYSDLLLEFNIELLVKYFNNLTFNISFFRYSMLLGNLQASLAAAKASMDMISLLNQGFKGLDDSDTDMLCLEVRNVVLQPNLSIKHEQLKKLKFSKNDTKSPIYMLLMNSRFQSDF